MRKILLKFSTVCLFLLTISLLPLMMYGQITTVDIRNITTGGVNVPNGALVGGVNTTNPWLTNSQIPNKPNATSLQNILGVNLTEATYTSLDTEHYTFLQSMAQISNQMRFFHLMDKDYAGTNTPTSLPDGCITNNGAFTGGVVCDEKDSQGRSIYTKMLSAFENYKSISTLMGGNKDLHVNHSLDRKFPDTWYNINEWGGSYDDATKLMTVTNVRTNARNYAKKFAQSYCPTATNCIVKVLEVGNEPWGEPGWPAYREILKGYTDGLTDIYGTSISTWPMRISIGAMQFFQDETVPLNKTQKQGISSASTNIYSSDYAGYMIPSGFEQYITTLNTHVYSVNNIPYTVTGKSQMYYKEDDFSYTLKQPEYAMSSFQKIKNMTLWKGATFPNLKEMVVSEFGWNSEDVIASKYFDVTYNLGDPSVRSIYDECKVCVLNPLKSVPLINNIRDASKATVSDISTNTSGADWLVFVKNRTNVFESRGVGEKAQAAYLVRAFLLMSRWGINKGFIYQSGDAITDAAYHHTGIIPQKITTTSTNIYESTNFNNAHFDSRKKKSFYALAKLRQYLGTGIANSPTTGKVEKNFLYALKEDTQAYVYVFGTKQANGTYIPTEIVAWNPSNINDGEQYDATTYMYDGQDIYGNPGRFYKRKPNGVSGEYIDFTSNHQLAINLQVGLNIDATHNFSNLQLDNTKKSVLLDWNYVGSGYTGTWQDLTPEKNNSEFVSSIASGQINFTKLTAIPVVIPITASGCVVNQDGTVSCSTCTLASPLITGASLNPSIACGSSVNLTATCPTGTTVQWIGGTGTFPSGVTASTITVSPQINTTYSATCTGSCTSTNTSTTVSVTGTCGGGCPISFNSFIQKTITLAGCGSPYAYILSFTANTNLSNVTIPITNLPNNGANSQTSSPSGAINYLSQTSFNWVIPTVTSGTTYTVTMNYCYNNTTPSAIATYSSTCSIPSGAGCTNAPQPPTIATPPSTALCNGSGVSLLTSCATGNIQWYSGATLLSPATSPLAITAAGIYTAKCTNACGTSGSSNPITITNTVNNNFSISANPTSVSNNTTQIILTASGCTGGTVSWTQGTTGTGASKIITGISASTTFTANCTINGCTSANSSTTVNFTGTTCPLSIVSFTRNIPTDPNCRTYNLTVKANVAISAANPQTMKMTVIPGNGFDPYGSTIDGVAVNGNANYNSWVDGGTAHTWTINSLAININSVLSLKFCWAPSTAMQATLLGCTSVTLPVVPVGSGARLMSADETSDEANLFTIYPNPTNDKLTVEYSLNKDSEINFGIMDMTGKTLQNRVINGKAGTHSFVMDVSKIIEGSYILRGIADDKSQAKKFVIIR
jgi:Secretion system C-terminal sorting domain